MNVTWSQILSISNLKEKPDCVEIRKFLVHVGIGYIGEKLKNQNSSVWMAILL